MKGAKRDLGNYPLDKRRRFLKFLPFAVTGTFSYPLYKFTFFNENHNRKASITLNDINDGITKIAKQEYFIYKNENKIIVFDAHCTHMGCILNYYKDKRRFICPCHHSNFTMEGKRIKGPAQRDLDTITFKIKNNKIFIG